MAGRPAGIPKTGGRKKGTPNKTPTAFREALAAKGELPLAYMLRIMRDKTADSDRRDRMANASAPYIHPKLASTEVTGKDGAPIEIADVSDDQRAKALAVALAKGGMVIVKGEKA